MGTLTEDPDLLSDEEFEKQLWLYILGSFPLGWSEAKRKILADRRARTLRMAEEPTSEQLLGKAMYEDDREQELLGLLEESFDTLPEGDLRDRIRKVLETS